MSYLKKLITRAVNQIAENNTIGKYTIEPMHGTNIFIYNISKDKQHIATIRIQHYTIIVNFESHAISFKESMDIYNSLN